MAKYLIGKVGVTKFSDLTNKPTTLAGYGITDAVASNKIGANNGVASLDSNGKIPTSQLPGSVDEIIEGYLYNGKFYEELAHTTEIPAAASKIYVDLPTNKTYRYSGSAYVEISASLALGETASTAYAGNKGKDIADELDTYKVKTISVNGTATTPDSNGNVDLTISSGGGGTSDYADLTNKPSINSVTLSGNKTSSDLGLVSAEQGKGLSTNDYTTADKNKLADIASGAEVNVLDGITVNGTDATISNKKVSITTVDGISLSNGTLAITANGTTVDSVSLPSTSTIDFSNVTNTPITLSGYGITDAVEKESGKGLSSNDYTSAEKTKLAGLNLKSVSINGTSQTPDGNGNVALTIGNDLAIITQNDDKVLQLKAGNTVIDSVTLPSGGSSTDYSVSIATSDWSQVSGQSYYSATKTVNGITSDDTPIIDIVPTMANYENEIADWAKLIKAETATDSIVFYASEAFTNAVSVIVKVV